jgi:hypothetical protein
MDKVKKENFTYLLNFSDVKKESPKSVDFKT